MYCHEHAGPDMVNFSVVNKCSNEGCERDYEFLVDDRKLCLEHAPQEFEVNIKRQCKWCDLVDSRFVCRECVQNSNKKEWAVVRHLRRTINTDFEHDSNRMLQGCSKRRPDAFFDLRREQRGPFLGG